MRSGGAFPPFGFPGLGSSARRCSFCSRREGSVATLVQARGVYICNHCIELAAAADASVRVVRIRPKTRLTIDRDEAEDANEAPTKSSSAVSAPTATAAPRSNPVTISW